MSRPSVLFVAYSFPPARTSGCVRTRNIAKYLARGGWTVTVLTPDPSLWRYVEDAEATAISLERDGVQRLLSDHRWRWLTAESVKCSNEGLAWFVGGVWRRISRHVGLDVSVGWVKAAERACSRLAAKDVDIILASGPPFSSFLVAQRLSQRLGCPYVVDYRDLWSRNLHYPAPAAVRREASVLAGSAAVTTVSPSWSLVLDREFGVGPKLHVVSNGYDSEELAKVEPHDFGHFAIVYTGVLHPPTRVISPVMAALRRLEDGAQGEHAQWKFHYYGRNQDHVLEEAERFGVRGRVIVYGNVPRPTALAAVKGAGVAVVVTSVVESVTTEDNGMVTGKIFEAIGLGTPILLIAPAGSDANSVAETSGLARSFSANDVGGIASFLRDLIRGRSLEPKNPAAFAWGNIVNGLDAVLGKAIGR